MFTSGSENTSWEYIPPKKLQTTLLIDSPPHALKELSGNTWKHSEPSSKKFTTIVTPKDCTRTNSPLIMPSPIFSDEEENDEMRSLYEQLILVRDRHTTLKTYINSIRAQLQQSFNLAIAELQGKRNMLISQVDLLYDEAFSKMCLEHKEKEIKIQAKDQELEQTLEEIENIIQRIEICGIEGDKLSRTIEKTLNIWVSENEVNGEWALLPSPSFDYTITQSSRINEPTKPKREGSHYCSSKKHRNHKHAECSHKGSNSRNSSHKSRQNTEIEQRIDMLEKTVSATLRPPKSKRLLENTFDPCMSESPISISTLYSDSSEIYSAENQIKVYIPQGYPSYACFYLIRVARDITIAQVLEKLTLHMGISQDNYCFKATDSNSNQKIIDNWKKAISFAKEKLYLAKS